MNEARLVAIRELIAQCTPEEQAALFRELRARHLIHEFEKVIGAPAEMILEAVHRAPELTRRMLRGVIADAAFRQFVILPLAAEGWRDVTPAGNFAFDYKVGDEVGTVTVQVKLQRSERGAPVIRLGERFGFGGSVHIVETQKTRTGTDGNDKQTRPYRYGEFDILAVSMQPSTGKWDRYMYTLGHWLLPGRNSGDIATLQPVAMSPDVFWTDDFRTAVRWFRADDGGKRMMEATGKKNKPVAKETVRKPKGR
ncbi:MAG: hypothetical protein ACKVQA_19970 [Burkholderiales bacterium]